MGESRSAALRLASSSNWILDRETARSPRERSQEDAVAKVRHLVRSFREA